MTTNKLTRKEAKQRTRQRLLDGLIEVARREGLQGLTTTKVADAAGVAQSSFYFHFEGMEDALRAAADRLGNQLKETIRSERQRVATGDREVTLRGAWEASINSMLAVPAFTQLFLRHRRDPTSPLGDTFSELLDQYRRELAEDISRYWSDLPNQAIYAELIVGMIMGVLEGLLDGRIENKQACIDALMQLTSAALSSVPSKRN
jgi:TetR/AcrR family transcriptional regulator, fatty acid biosynthesis regulator